jgi:hypothetical protein
MAGAFTHFILCDVAKRKRSVIGPVLYRLLNKHSRFLFLGAGSPDLPYLSISGNTKWADVFHYEKTNGIAISGHAELKKRWPEKTNLEEAIFAWFLGYVSHLVTDATIHPVVQAIVGLYEKNPEEHRICEMTQDSLIYSEKKNTDLAYAEFSSVLKFCGDSEHFDGVMDFWKTQTKKTYPEKKDEPQPKFWFTTYSNAVDAAEGGSTLVALFRHIGGSYSEYIYKPKAEILSDFPDRYRKYYGEVKLPNGKFGTFTKDAFDKAINYILDAWTTLYEGLTKDIVVSNTIKNWYLDTGVDMDLPFNVVTYWRQNEKA